MRNGQKLAMLKKSCKFVKNKLFSIRIIHAHLKYIWNKCAKNSNETMKALGGLDFIKYSPTCLKQAAKRNTKIACLRQVLPVCRKSMEPVEKIHGISGQSSWNPWTLSGWSIGTKTLDNFQ